MHPFNLDAGLTWLSQALMLAEGINVKMPGGRIN